MKATKAILHTNLGDINVTLFPDQAPKTVDNFASLATGEREYKDDAGRTNPTPFYDGLIFHRIIAGFMIQGGCPARSGHRRPRLPASTTRSTRTRSSTKPYLLAMANAGKRGGKGTNGSQFFITVGATPWLNGKHTIFGEVADGPSREVVDKISERPDRPR